MMGKYKHLLFIGSAIALIAFSISIVIPAHPVNAADGKCTTDQINQGYTQQSGKDADGNESFTCNPPAAKPGTTDKQASSDTTSDTTCAIEMMGWVLCPVMSTVGKIGDRAFSLLADNFLKTEPQLVSNTDLGTRYAWGLARNLANIMFIIALLVIIYSQVTGAGINNYGIKKMLPRLIVAAIAVNLSYFICQGMVDLSNIFGYEIKNFLDGAAASVSKFAAMPPAGSIAFGADSPGTLETIIKYALGVASLVWFLLPLMFMSAGSIVIICIIIVVILLLRKAFIVLLVVVSPIAFVLYLLPNTERYFRKWLSMLWQLLMVFPVVGLLFGGGQLASAIVLAAGSGAQSNQGGTYYSDKKCIQLPSYQSSNSGNNSTTLNLSATPNPATIGTCGTNSTSLMLGLIATGIAVAPLFAVVSVLKGALAAAGAIGGKISGAVEQGTRKAGDWGSKNTAIGRGMAARQAIKQNYKDQKFARKMAGTGATGAWTRYAARGISGNIGRFPGAPGSFSAQNDKLGANFAGAAAKIDEQNVKDRQSLIQSTLNNTRGQKNSAGVIEDDMTKVAGMLEDAIKSGDKEGIKAATNMLMNMGSAGRGKIRKTMDNADTGGGNSEGAAVFRHHITEEHAGLKSTDADVYAAASDWASHGSLAHASGDQGVYDSLTNEQMASQSKDSLGAGAIASLNGTQTVVSFDSTGTQVTQSVRRKHAILNSEAAKNITDRSKFS